MPEGSSASNERKWLRKGMHQAPAAFPVWGLLGEGGTDGFLDGDAVHGLHPPRWGVPHAGRQAGPAWLSVGLARAGAPRRAGDVLRQTVRSAAPALRLARARPGSD